MNVALQATGTAGGWNRLPHWHRTVGGWNPPPTRVIARQAGVPAQTRARSAGHEADLAEGHGEVRLPHALDRKYPNAGKEWAWQYVFPSAILSPDREDGKLRRLHTAESNLQKAVKEALRAEFDTLRRQLE